MDTFLSHFADAINLVDHPLQAGDKLSDLPNWDSLAILMTISMLDIEYRVTVSGTELQACSTVEDVYQLTRENSAEA
jgi:acyl carrier protein